MNKIPKSKKPIIKKLNSAMKRIDNGDYITEEEFFKERSKV